MLTIAAGVFHMDLASFILASIVARAMRFYLVAALLYWFWRADPRFHRAALEPGDHCFPGRSRIARLCRREVSVLKR